MKKPQKATFAFMALTMTGLLMSPIAAFADSHGQHGNQDNHGNFSTSFSFSKSDDQNQDQMSETAALQMVTNYEAQVATAKQQYDTALSQAKAALASGSLTSSTITSDDQSTDSSSTTSMSQGDVSIIAALQSLITSMQNGASPSQVLKALDHISHDAKKMKNDQKDYQDQSHHLSAMIWSSEKATFRAGEQYGRMEQFISSFSQLNVNLTIPSHAFSHLLDGRLHQFKQKAQHYIDTLDHWTQKLNEADQTSTSTSSTSTDSGTSTTGTTSAAGSTGTSDTTGTSSTSGTATVTVTGSSSANTNS